MFCSCKIISYAYLRDCTYSTPLPLGVRIHINMHIKRGGGDHTDAQIHAEIRMTFFILKVLTDSYNKYGTTIQILSYKYYYLVITIM